jgi:hypothetical protein
VKDFQNEADAKRWEISENLHRAELKELEHSRSVAEWTELMKGNDLISAQVAPKSKNQKETPEVRDAKKAASVNYRATPI